MSKLDTKHTKIMLFVYCVAVIIGFGLFIDISQNWNEHQTRSLRLIIIEGILLEAVGFIILRKPIIIRIYTKRETNFTTAGIFCIITGLFIQGISVYFSS